MAAGGGRTFSLSMSPLWRCTSCSSSAPSACGTLCGAAAAGQPLPPCSARRRARGRTGSPPLPGARCAGRAARRTPPGRRVWSRSVSEIQMLQSDKRIAPGRPRLTRRSPRARSHPPGPPRYLPGSCTRSLPPEPQSTCCDENRMAFVWRVRWMK
jgi:hypothetical protein